MQCDDRGTPSEPLAKEKAPDHGAFLREVTRRLAPG